MSAGHGTLYLVPNSLDFGIAAGEPVPDLADVLPLGVIRRAAGIAHWIAENARTTRAFLKRVDAVVALARPLQSIVIVELPRPRKGRLALARDAPREHAQLLAPLLAGVDAGLISEAGLPAVADPGALTVAAAHALDIRVVALAGPSSLLLALASSGLNGQSFAFVGYLPVESEARAERIRQLEALSRRAAQTQLMIETPYRNRALLDALLAHLQPATRLSVSCGLTLERAFTRSDSIGSWRSHAALLPADMPAVFSLLG